MKWVVKAILPVLAASAGAGFVSFEGEVFPETVGWERLGSGGATRLLEEGFFVQFGVVIGALDGYRRSLAGFAGRATLFIEWRVETDAPSSLLDASRTPVALVAGGSSFAFYHTTITDQRVQLFQDTSIPLVFVDIEPGMPHVYRLELYGEALYAWYIDGQTADLGVPLGPYPNADSRLTWAVRHYQPGYTTRWDYVRFGLIPLDASGDYDSDEDIDGRDFYFFHECLTNARPGINGGPGNDAGPGCRFADFDADDDVDLLDFAAFQRTFTGGQ